MEGRCSHARAIPEALCSFCSSAGPESLLDLCFSYVLSNRGTICMKGSPDRLRPDLVLPVELCERLLAVGQARDDLDNVFLGIFRDREATRLKRVKLRRAKVDDESLKCLLEHKLVELELACCPALTPASVGHVSANSEALQSLAVGEEVPIFPLAASELRHCQDRGHVFFAPGLKKLALKGLNVRADEDLFFDVVLRGFAGLTHLDLSDCRSVGQLAGLAALKELQSLVLYNVANVASLVPQICRLGSLRHLDIAMADEGRGKYANANLTLSSIVQALPGLVSLDISGTNLAGTGVAEQSPGQDMGASDIPGLATRVKNPFQFLGLYGTSHEACRRHDIPAKMISGDANEEQVLIAATAYIDRPAMLQKVLNDLYHLFRFCTCEHIGQALTVVLDAMERHLKKKHIQISGSATLFYIVKGKEKETISVRVKRRIISALLNGMFAHKHDDTMMRNGCLTLCQFKIAQDMLFEYERLVNILLHSVHQGGFVQRIGIYLLNSVACQVDGAQKQKLGDLGVISKMIWVISERLTQMICDDVLEVAWSTMWNVTDEMPCNCFRFLERKGMEYFLKCLEKFPMKEELLRNMMGLLGNVAEVKSLRPYLMTTEYVTVFADLLDSISDGIEVSYNAAGVLSHMASDGVDSWTVKKPTRYAVLKRMVQAVHRWDISTERNINYRSFEPILGLIKIYDTPECQLWAVWALANLTTVYPEKYCSLVQAEGGIEILEHLFEHESTPSEILYLAAAVVANCQQYQKQHEVDAESNLEG